MKDTRRKQFLLLHGQHRRRFPKSKIKRSLFPHQIQEARFGEKVFSMKQIKHTPKIKKEAPSENSIACLKCNSVFDTSEELSSHEKKCYVKYC